MRVAVVGLGKLGMPIALSLARKHDVVGYDVSPRAKEILATRRYPHQEERAQLYLDTTTLRVVDTVGEAVAHGDVVLVIVQTPHQARFEGATRLPEDRADFDYTYLKAAVAEIAAAAAQQRKTIVLAVMSTVLPGTCKREIKPLLNEYTKFVYTPAFPAMGTAIPDFENPEFHLVGVDDFDAAGTMRHLFTTLDAAEVVTMSVASAEATKVFYNSAITSKVQLANTWMEIAHRLGDVDVDDVSRALSKATARVVSPMYMRGGMGDGGGCLTPGSIVYTEQGTRPISTIWPGDKVLASDGTYRAVIETYKRPYKGVVVAVQVEGLWCSKFTPNHPFQQAMFPVEAGQLFKGSWVAFPQVPFDAPAIHGLPKGTAQVATCEREAYEGTVWNLNVEGTHDYVTSAGTVLNCHPRDNIALSWLSHSLGMPYDLFGDLMRVREHQTAWLAEMCQRYARKHQLPIVILGRAYKAGVGLMDGSPARLLRSILDEGQADFLSTVEQWDPYIDEPRTFTAPAVFCIATNHEQFYAMEYPAGSVILDPWGRAWNREDVTVVRVGRT